ncbi:diguanylate cyclase domain-containing protein [Cellulomonas aerilata]|uniref:GGDEF domain-containing protein n=1 Tax=Cellulomonas aerilata TaxID=515326 RepID=A0A512DAM1_9CELL|nr:diguanylate cyclase [Cellulomonas aerilata]GEO33522.1 hypothetical protein CAE01nite_12470 [Cellulomonas aerilata]
MLLTDLPLDDAAAAAHVVVDRHDAPTQPFTVDGAEHRTDVTIGTALFPRDGRTTRDLIAHADAADADMYRGKPSRPALRPSPEDRTSR